MDNFLIYLLKVSTGTTLLYISYLILFSKDTFHLRNRIFLILVLILPVILPMVKIPVNSENMVTAEMNGAMYNIFIPEAPAATTAVNSVNQVDYNKIFILIYFTIAGLLILRVIISVISTFRIIRKGTVISNQFPKVITTGPGLPPFSFFPYIIMPAEDFNSPENNDIFEHEFAHIRQGHTFDLLLSELSIALQWFNPFVWLIKRSVKLNHEYLADRVSLGNNNNLKEYQLKLLRFQTGLKDISLAHSFNNVIKNRIIMINRKPTGKYAALKNIIIIPVAASLTYAFAIPEYKYPDPAAGSTVVNQVAAVTQNRVKGIVLGEDGKPLTLVTIMVTGPDNIGVQTGSDGHFVLDYTNKDASLVFSCIGYKSQTLKPDFTKEMVIRMAKDPKYKSTVMTPDAIFHHEGEKVRIRRTDDNNWEGLIVIDDKISNSKGEITVNRDDIGMVKVLKNKEATDKYGDKGKHGVIEITTKKRAAELGLKTPPPEPRNPNPADYPTFQGESRFGFQDWVAGRVRYPAEAQTKQIEGWVMVNFNVNKDGSLSDFKSTIPVNSLLSEEVIRVVRSSPKWEPPKNPDKNKPTPMNVTLKFKLPDKIIGKAPYVALEEMPEYPGGSAALTNFIKKTITYPEQAKAEKVIGNVIIRFIVNTEGNPEGISVLKGVHPLLDAEAIRVVSMLTGFKPGMNRGEAVNTWYMIPVNFSLPGE
jgi:TonB family protein